MKKQPIAPLVNFIHMDPSDQAGYLATR